MIRLFRDADLVPLHDLICGTIDVSYSGVYPKRAVAFFKEYHSKDAILKRGQTGEILIAEKAGAMVATGSLVKNEVSGVFVKPDLQNQGLGKAIMRELENRAVSRGFVEVTLDVSLPSRGFYEGLGYEMLTEHKIDVGEGQFLRYWPGRKRLKS